MYFLDGLLQSYMFPPHFSDSAFLLTSYFLLPLNIFHSFQKLYSYPNETAWTQVSLFIFIPASISEVRFFLTFVLICHPVHHIYFSKTQSGGVLFYKTEENIEVKGYVKDKHLF